MLASLYFHLKRFDDVIRTLEDKAPPENRLGMPHEWLLLAMSYWHLGEKAKAEEYYEKVISGWAAAYARRVAAGVGTAWVFAPSFFWIALLAGRAAAPAV